MHTQHVLLDCKSERQQEAEGGLWEFEVVCEDNQFKHNQKLRGIKATVMR